MSGEETTGGRTRFVSRRRVLGSIGAAGALALAGCSGNGGGNGNGGNGTGGNGGSGNGAGGNGASGDGTGGGSGTGVVGQSLSGEFVSFMVEYVTPVETVLEFDLDSSSFDDYPYARPRDVGFYVDKGLARPGDSFYGVGVAIKNTHDRPLDVSTQLLQGEDGIAFGVFPGQSQQLAFAGAGRNTSRVLARGELMRAEVVFALSKPASGYTLVFDPRDIVTGATERFEVDLSGGSEATAGFSQGVSTAPMGQSVQVGDFEVTVHSVDRTDNVTDSPYQDIFGPRSGYQYLVFDLSATRTSDDMSGQEWSLGMVDDEGYAFSWGWKTVYQDALDLNRTALEDLAVGESIDHTTLAFPVAEAFSPRYVTMNVPGPFEDAPEFGADYGIHRVFWSLQ